MPDTFPKDPAEVKDFTIDYDSQMESGDIIATSVWSVPTGITKDSQNQSGSNAIITLSGGTALENYTISNVVTTNNGLTLRGVIYIICLPANIRLGMVNLIRRLRRLVNDQAGSTWTAEQMQEILDANRVEFYALELDVQPLQTGPNTVVYKIYRGPYQNLEERTSGADVCRVSDSTGTEVSTANYSVDYINGIVTFSADQAGSVRFMDGRAYDLNGAAAQAWLEQAGNVSGKFNFTKEGASFSVSDWFEHCNKMYEFYSAQAWPKFGEITRSDLN